MTLVREVYLLQSENLQTDLRCPLIKFLRNTQALTEQNLLFPNHRKEWQLLWILRMLRIS